MSTDTIDLIESRAIDDAPRHEVASEVVDAAPTRAIATLDPLTKIKNGLAHLDEEAKAIAALDLNTTAGDKAQRALRLKCVTLRTSVDEAYETINRPLLETQREARKLVADIKAAVALIETPADAAIQAREKAKAAAKKAAEEVEAARVAAHRANIAKIKGYIAQAHGATAAKLQVAIDFLKSVPIDEAYQEFQAEAEAARDDTLLTLENMLDQAQEREAEAERVRLQKIENDRVAAELETQRRALAEQAAELKRQQDEADARARAAEAEEARRIEQADEHAALAAVVPAAEPEGTTEGQHSQQVLKAEPETADATDRGTVADASPRGGAMGVGQAAAAAPAVDPDTDDLPLTLSLEDEAVIRSLLAHIDAAFAGTKFPSHPKPGPAWWAELAASRDRVRGLLA